MSNNIVKIALVVVAGILAFNLYSRFANTADGDELKTLIKNGAYLVDVRTPGEFSSGHVEGSVNIPLQQLEQRLADFEGKEPIVVFCQSGARSGRAKSILESNGFKDVTNGGTWKNVKKVKAEVEAEK